jgi:hypothetical protein
MNLMRRSALARLGAAALAVTLATSVSAAPAYAADELDGGTVEGTFTTADGTPLAGASVTIFTYDHWYVTDMDADEAGQWAIVNIAPGDYKVRFSWGNHEQWAYQHSDFASAATLTVHSGETTEVDDRVMPRGTIAGLLTDGSGGPSGGTTVWVQDVHTDAWTASSYTTNDGRYSIDVPAGQYRVWFSRTNAGQYAYHASDAESATTFDVSVDQIVEVDDAMPARGSISGKLKSSRGGPAFSQDAHLYRNGVFLESAETDEVGVYSFSELTPGDGYSVAFSRLGYARQWAYGKRSAADAATFTVIGGQETVVNERLLAGGTVVGRFTKTDGTSPAWVKVALELDGAEPGSPTSYETYTEVDGTWSFEGVLPGDYLASFTDSDTGRRQYAYGRATAADAARVTVRADVTTTVDDKQIAAAPVSR